MSAPPTSTGQTALMMAVSRSLTNLEGREMSVRALEMVDLSRLLRSAGARNDIRDASGKTALDYLNEAASRLPNHPRAQYEKVRLIVDPPVR